MVGRTRSLSGYTHDLIDGAMQVSLSDLAISVFVLMNFAIAQPLLDVLGRHGTFFPAHDMGAWEVVLFAILVTLVLPVFVVILITGLHLVHRQATRVVYMVVTVGLWLAIVLPLVDRVVSGPTLLVLLLAGLMALAATAIFLVAHPVRLFVRFGLIGPPAFLVIFLALSPASGIVKGGTPEIGNVDFGNAAPVVVIVLDEFPLASIMDPSGEIDSKLFPNLGRLAGSSTWFRGAETVSGVTERAVPALLSGDDPGKDESRLPIASDYPTNFFTVLGDAYDMVAIEEVSQLCPDDTCRHPSEDTQRVGKATTVRDVVTVYMHLVLPETLRSRLPVIDDGWAGFTTGPGNGQPRQQTAEPNVLTEDKLHQRLREAIRSDAVASFETFLDSIEPTSSPTAWFGHFMVPHAPWDLLPTGARYEAEREPQPGRAPENGVWGPDEWLVTHAYQRHLLQVGLVDRLIGRLLDRLESSGLYEETLLVVASDHGIAFLPDNRRRLTPETIGGVKHVPMFVKLPGQTEPYRSDEQVFITDILPTIVDVLEGDIEWEGSGRSLLPTMADGNSQGPLPAPLEETVERKHKLFPLEHGWVGLHRFGPFGELVGTAISAVKVVQPKDALRADLWHHELYDYVEIDSAFVPALARGVLIGLDESVEEDRFLAVALNGTIAAIGRTYANNEHQSNFMTTLWPEAFKEGRNDVVVYLIDEEGGEPILTPLVTE